MTTATFPARTGTGTGAARQLAGTGALLRFNLRRDRVVVPTWVAVTALLVLSLPGSLRSVYSTPAERADLARQMLANSSLRATYGPVFSDSLGGLTAWRIGGYAAILAGIMSLIVVVRHTRDEEESGRQELVSSAMVGRRAPLTAALLTAFVANSALALLITAGLAGQGSAGALALGLGIGGVGMVFATLAAIVAQFTDSGRLAKGLTGGLVGTAFVLRAAGDATTNDASSPLTWLSPIGWLENLRPFASERWWVLALFAAAALVQGLAAYELAGRRDVGMSFLPARPGPAHGRLGTAAALAWRLQRGPSWAGAWASSRRGSPSAASRRARRTSSETTPRPARSSSGWAASRASRTRSWPRWSACSACWPPCTRSPRSYDCTARRPAGAPNRSWRTRWAACAGRPAIWRSPSGARS